MKVDSDPAWPVRQRIHVLVSLGAFGRISSIFFSDPEADYVLLSGVMEKCAQSMLRLLAETVARGKLDTTFTSSWLSDTPLFGLVRTLDLDIVSLRPLESSSHLFGAVCC